MTWRCGPMTLHKSTDEWPDTIISLHVFINKLTTRSHDPRTPAPHAGATLAPLHQTCATFNRIRISSAKVPMFSVLFLYNILSGLVRDMLYFCLPTCTTALLSRKYFSWFESRVFVRGVRFLAPPAFRQTFRKPQICGTRVNYPALTAASPAYTAPSFSHPAPTAGRGGGAHCRASFC